MAKLAAILTHLIAGAVGACRELALVHGFHGEVRLSHAVHLEKHLNVGSTTLLEAVGDGVRLDKPLTVGINIASGVIVPDSDHEM